MNGPNYPGQGEPPRRGFMNIDPGERPSRPAPGPVDDAEEFEGFGWLSATLRLRLARLVIVFIVASASAGGLWFAYEKGRASSNAGGAVPLIKADQTPMKVKPTTQDGVSGDTDNAVTYVPGSSGNGQVENLLPPAEAPMQKPQPSADALPEVPGSGGEQTTTAAIAPAVPAAPATAAPSAAAPPVAAPPAAPAAVATTPSPALAPSAPVALTPPPQAPPADAAPALSMPAGPSVQLAGAGTFRVQLAATRDSAAAAKEWQRIRHAHADLLGSLALTVERADLGSKGIYYRVQAGPLADRPHAAALCDSLKNVNVPCHIVVP